MRAHPAKSLGGMSNYFKQVVVGHQKMKNIKCIFGFQKMTKSKCTGCTILGIK